jgi:hypothetical protein
VHGHVSDSIAVSSLRFPSFIYDSPQWLSGARVGAGSGSLRFPPAAPIYRLFFDYGLGMRRCTVSVIDGDGESHQLCKCRQSI